MYPGLKTCSDATELINDPQIDAVVIATPVSSHFDLAMSALKAGKHVLVEKPLAATSDQARKLVDEAAARNLDSARGPHVCLHRCGAQDS